MDRLSVAALVVTIMMLLSAFSTAYVYRNMYVMRDVEAAFDASGNVLIRKAAVKDFLEESLDKVWESYSERLEKRPYDPGFFAWGVQYEIRTYILAYRLTRDVKWVERAVARCDHLYSYSDVNGDGIPSWGNYNRTYGNPRYEREGYREFGVWDGVLSTALMDVVQAVLSDPMLNSSNRLREKALTYLSLVEAIVKRYHDCWTPVGSEMGYYWDSPSGDVVGPVTNRFAALGIAELKLNEILRDPEYLERPERMARLFKFYLRTDDGCYVWGYKLGTSPYEDISHGAIDLEFLMLAYRHGIVFEKDNLERLAQTYREKIWRGFTADPPLATRVDGSVYADYTGYSRNWVMLAEADPMIWVYQWYALSSRSQVMRFNPCYLQAVAQLQEYFPGPEQVAKSVVDEAENRLGELSWPLTLFSPPLKSTLDRAQVYIGNGDYVEAFKAGLKVLVSLERVSTLGPVTASLGTLTALLCVLLAVLLLKKIRGQLLPDKTYPKI